MRTQLLTALIASSVVSIAGLAQAATIAGWDFSQYAASGSLVKDLTLVPSNSLAANYSNLLAPPYAGPAAGGFGTLYFDGSFGSTSVDPNSLNPALVPTASAPDSLTSNLSAPTTTVPFDSQGALKSAGQPFFNVLTMTATAPVLAVFEAELGGPPPPTNHWELKLGGKTFSGTSTLGVEFSADGISYSPMTTFNLTTADTLFSAPLAAAVTDKAYVRLNLDPSGGQPIVDNVEVILLPEPSTTAQAVISLLSLALFHRIRRHR